jgi:hypothetical protein
MIKYIKNIIKIILLAVSVFWLIFALLSGAETFDGGIKGILLNIPNILPWLILIVLICITFRWELVGAIIVLLFGIGTIFAFGTFEHLIPFLIISLPFILLSSFLITMHFWERCSVDKK